MYHWLLPHAGPGVVVGSSSFSAPPARGHRRPAGPIVGRGADSPTREAGRPGNIGHCRSDTSARWEATAATAGSVLRACRSGDVGDRVRRPARARWRRRRPQAKCGVLGGRDVGDREARSCARKGGDGGGRGRGGRVSGRSRARLGERGWRKESATASAHVGHRAGDAAGHGQVVGGHLAKRAPAGLDARPRRGRVGQMLWNSNSASTRAGTSRRVEREVRHVLAAAEVGVARHAVGDVSAASACVALQPRGRMRLSLRGSGRRAGGG